MYGRPRPPAVTDPFALIVLENAAYLATDAKRDEAFALLAARVGLDPEKILDAPDEILRQAGGKGILPAESARKLREAARIAIANAAALRTLTHVPPAAAKKILRRFPSIGEPGAEKILLYAGIAPLLALDSNGLRVLGRLGYGREEASYAASYRSAQAAAQRELPARRAALLEARELLRRHGQELCTRSRPGCEACPLRGGCAYAARERRGSIA
jgi:endonuclease-3